MFSVSFSVQQYLKLWKFDHEKGLLSLRFHCWVIKIWSIIKVLEPKSSRLPLKRQKIVAAYFVTEFHSEKGEKERKNFNIVRSKINFANEKSLKLR